MSDLGTPAIRIDDPFDQAVANYERKAAVNPAPAEAVKPPSQQTGMLERIGRLEDLVERLQYGMENCTAELECDEEGTGGTITITFPDPDDFPDPGP